LDNVIGIMKAVAFAYSRPRDFLAGRWPPICREQAGLKLADSARETGKNGAAAGEMTYKVELSAGAFGRCPGSPV